VVSAGCMSEVVLDRIFGENKMNVLRKPWYSSLIKFLIWLIVIMRIQDLLFVIHHRSLYQIEGKSINFLELISIIFFLELLLI
jgi:hypothetical protein